MLVSIVTAATTLCATQSGRLAPLALSLKRDFVQGVGKDESSAASLSLLLLDTKFLLAAACYSFLWTT